MSQKTGQRAAEALDGARGGMQGLRGLGDRMAGKMGIRKSPAARVRARMPGKGWTFAAALAAVGAATLILYLRKRRQVAAHYKMGEGERPWEEGGFRDFGAAGAMRP